FEEGVTRQSTGTSGLGGRRATDDRAISLYVHIPFCASRCPYCDFATAPATSALRARYMSALARELREQGAALGRPVVRTLYVGGGTPSLLEPDEIAALAGALRSSFALELAEATVEANPATLDRARLEAWAALGITRLSLGAQSFSAHGLRELGRTHQPEDVAPAVKAARSLGLAVSVDLIFGWPGQTLDEWRGDLASAVALGVDHVSCYPLELVLDPEESSVDWPGGGWEVVRRWRERAAMVQPGDDTVARMYRIAERLLAAAGFDHYEIANWARPGQRCRHNLVYWRNGQWLGAGTGAHAHLGGRRSRRPGSLLAYLNAIEGAQPRIDDPSADDAVDTAMLGLRLAEGLDLATYEVRFGMVAAAHVRRVLADVALKSLVRVADGCARLTPRGRLLASEVFVRLLPDDPHAAREEQN
ncbi:MAG: radical SAM family heme chaperone HemW, partial [Chloroflexota bacterium]